MSKFADAVIAEMKLSPDTSVAELTEDQIVEFKADQVGAELWGEWGEEVPEKVAMLQHRWTRLRNAVPESDRPAFDDFVDGLPPAAFKEALRQLAG